MDYGSVVFEFGFRFGDLLIYVNDEVIFVWMFYFDVIGINVIEILIEIWVLLGIVILGLFIEER